MLDQSRPLTDILQTIRQGGFQERWDAVKLLPQFGEAAIAALMPLLQSDDSELCWFAAVALTHFHHPQAMAALMPLLQSADEDLSDVASHYLAQVGETMIPELKAAITVPESRVAGVSALSRMHSSAVIEPLLTVTADPNSDIRVMALAALKSFDDRRILPHLVQALQDSDADVRQQGAIGLGLAATRVDAHTYGIDWLAVLTPCLQDENLDVVYHSAAALGRVGTDAAAIALLEKMTQRHTLPTLRWSIAQILGWMERSIALQGLAQQLAANTDHRLAQEIIHALGLQKKPLLRQQAATILVDWFNQTPAMLKEDFTLRQGLAMALGHLQQPIGLATLQHLLHDPVPGVCLHAQRALQELASERKLG